MTALEKADGLLKKASKLHEDLDDLAERPKKLEEQTTIDAPTFRIIDQVNEHRKELQ